MAIKIKFDPNNIVESPTFVLATKSGRKLGNIPAYNISFNEKMKDKSEVFFNVDRMNNGVKYHLWDKLDNLKLAYCVEWDALFELSIEIDESNDSVKNAVAKSLGEAELSTTLIFDVEINTERDIARDDYEPTVLFDPDNPHISLLHRILEKAPHYKVVHVDKSIANLERIYSFNEIGIYNAMKEIEEDITCYFKIETTLGDDNKISRNIYVYDLKSYCLDCNERNEFADVCPNCGSSNYINGYGQDTTIFISTEKLADTINCSVDVDAVKNCYRLSAGDDLLTATLINCNPNGSAYIWHFTDETKDDMSKELVEKLDQYDELYQYYSTRHTANISMDIIEQYNQLVNKYSKFSDKLSPVPNPIIGFSSLLGAYYNAIDFHLYLKSGLMPDVSMQSTSAELEAKKLTNDNIEFIAVANLGVVSAATASSAALSIARTIVDSRYQVKVHSGSMSEGKWTGNFDVINYSDEEDAATSALIVINVTDEYEKFIKQKIDKVLSNSSDDVTDASSLFKLDLSAFNKEITKYSLSRLISFHDACQACLNVLIEQGIGSREVWENSEPDLYNNLYIPYYNKLLSLESEIKVRESEIAIICGTYDPNGDLVSDGLQTQIESERKKIQNSLDYEKFIGKDLWLELISYRREDVYKDDNYISDGLSNADLIKNAMELVHDAEKDILKASKFQHTITGTLKNFLVLKEFTPIVRYFEIGNWIRLKVDNTIYRLRLIGYNIDFNNIESIEVEFSDAVSMSGGVDKSKRIFEKAASMASTYSTVSRHAEQGKQSIDHINSMISDGISVSDFKIGDGSANENMSWDSNGVMLKKYDDISDEYDSCQLKMYNSTISLTADNWRNVKTAIGGHYYTDPKTGQLKYAFGINAEVLIGKLILGEELGIYNETGSLTFDKDGFVITNGTNSFIVDPNDDMLLSITHGIRNIFYIDRNGELYIAGNGSNVDIENNSSVISLNGLVEKNSDAIYSETVRALLVEQDLQERILRNATSIESEVARAKSEESGLKGLISENKKWATEAENRLASIEDFLSKNYGYTYSS